MEYLEVKAEDMNSSAMNLYAFADSQGVSRLDQAQRIVILEQRRLALDQGKILRLIIESKDVPLRSDVNLKYHSMVMVADEVVIRYPSRDAVIKSRFAKVAENGYGKHQQ